MNELEIEFRLERERRYLEQCPSKAIELALNYLEDFLNLAKETRAMERRNQSLLADNQALTSQLIEMYEQIPMSKITARRPHFLKCHRH